MAATFFARRPLLSKSRLFGPSVRKPLVMSRERSTFSGYLVTPEQLEAALKANAPSKVSTAPRTIPVCGSWFLPNDPHRRTGRHSFRYRHIPTSRFFDLDKVADTSSPYPHMLPSPEVFQEAMSSLGINIDDTLVVYDTAELGIFSAPRVAWTMRVFGHPQVHILNNFKLWVEKGMPTEDGAQKSYQRTEYPKPNLDKSKVVAFEEMRDLARDYKKEGAEEFQVLDARSEGRWRGTEPEPREGISSGHIPGSASVPVPVLLDPKTKTLLPAEELRKVFESRGVDPHKPIISSCGTGVTAAVIDAALMEAGYNENHLRIYDGSWTEWAQRVRPSDNLIVKES